MPCFYPVHHSLAVILRALHAQNPDPLSLQERVYFVTAMSSFRVRYTGVAP
jgi:hypothetical protein